MKTDPNYFHLNLGNRWPKFELTNLEIGGDGAMQLRALARLSGRLPEELHELPIPQAPAGMAPTGDGALFFTDPDHHLLWRIDPCDPDNTSRPAPRLGGEGSGDGQFSSPRGLLFLPDRGLLIADTGNNRIQIIDPGTLRVREIWGGFAHDGEPALREPWAMAADGEGSVYVVTAGDHGLQKMDRWGRVDFAFRSNVEACCTQSPPQRVLVEPVAVAVAAIDGEERVLVLDRSLRALVLFNLDGQWLNTFAAQELQEPLTLAVFEKVVYIGDGGEQNLNVLQFDLPALGDDQLHFAGAAVGYRGPIAALFLDFTAELEKSCHHKPGLLSDDEKLQPRLWLLPGSGATPVVLTPGTGYLTSGFALAGPFDFRRQPVTWHRLQAITKALPPHTHVRFFFRLSATPSPADLALFTEEPFSTWCAFPPDATEGLFASFAGNACRQLPAALNANGNGRNPLVTATYLWLGLQFSGDGTATPRMHQIRLQFNEESYLPHLPAIYSDEENSKRFLLPLLSLFESFFAEHESATADLPTLFDPAAAPVEFLDWLAGWLAQDLKEEWSAEHKRRLIAEAFASYARRGTVAGLRQRLQEFAGTHAHVLEPLQHLDLWSLDETSTLNFDTMLAAAEAQGAVLGATAMLDHSHLITNAEFGSPLFEEVAHRFAVMIYPNVAGSPQRLAEIEAVIERDKPAHTAYHLCLIRPGLRLGFQSRVGIDTVVGGPAPATPLAEHTTGGLVLAGEPLAKLGERKQVGINTQL